MNNSTYQYIESCYNKLVQMHEEYKSPENQNLPLGFGITIDELDDYCWKVIRLLKPYLPNIEDDIYAKTNSVKTAIYNCEFLIERLKLCLCENEQAKEKNNLTSDNTDTESDQGDQIVFISHCSNDKKYGNALRDYIIGLGVKDNQLIYSSHPLHKIPMDENIYDYLRKKINFNVFMIILWSNDYLDSPACLNEMGALWVVQADYTNIYVPSFSFGNPKYHQCAVDTRKMGTVLNGDQRCKASMIELKNKIQALFGLEDDERRSSFLLDNFIRAISEESENGKTENAKREQG